MPAAKQLLQQGRYRVIQPPEPGENGGVFRASDTVLGANVVIKEFSAEVRNAAPEATRDAGFAERAKIFIGIEHPALASVRESFAEADRRYLATGGLDGNFLSDLLEKQKRPFALRDVLIWLDALLDALNYLHTLAPPVIHGEIKPQNLALGADGAIKLLCFPSNGEAVAMPYAPLETIWSQLDSASRNVILKSYDEKSEKILEQPPDARSDLYALGATIYHLLTGRQPVDALERSIDILEGKPDPLPPLHAVNPQILPEISEVLMRTLEIRRENRFSSALITRQILRTAFARVREREALETKKREAAALEIKLAEQKREEARRAAQERESAEQKRLAEEAEEKRRNELIKQQLREAESKRLAAERRAAEAERRLSEIEAEKSSAETAKTNIEKPAEKIDKPQEISIAAREKVAPPVVAPSVVAADELPSLFAEPPKESKMFRGLAAGAAILLMLGGATWAAFGWLGTKSAEPIQAPPPTALYEQPQPAPTVEPTPAPTVESAPAADAPPVASSSPEFEPPSADAPPNGRVKTPPAARRVKRQTATADKPPTGQKKIVTVDDIINDN